MSATRGPVLPDRLPLSLLRCDRRPGVLTEYSVVVSNSQSLCIYVAVVLRNFQSFASLRSTLSWRCDDHTSRMSCRACRQGRPLVLALAFVLGAWGTSVPLAYFLGFIYSHHHDGANDGSDSSDSASGSEAQGTDKSGLGLLGLWIAMAAGCESRARALPVSMLTAFRCHSMCGSGDQCDAMICRWRRGCHRLHRRASIGLGCHCRASGAACRRHTERGGGSARRW
eukprot:SAG11_NODE_373_length_10031_cov_37.400020_4_plen_226_part_00